MTRHHLTLDERAILAELVGRDNLSNGVVVRIFEARTGRRLHKSTVRVARLKGYKAEAEDRSGHLTIDQRETLKWLISESGEEVPYSEIARQFEAVTGRAVTTNAVWVFATTHLGRRRVGQGRRSWYRRGSVEARVEEALAVPRAEPKVDRSSRVVRTGRLPAGWLEEDCR